MTYYTVITHDTDGHGTLIWHRREWHTGMRHRLDTQTLSAKGEWARVQRAKYLKMLKCCLTDLDLIEGQSVGAAAGTVVEIWDAGVVSSWLGAHWRHSAISWRVLVGPTSGEGRQAEDALTTLRSRDFHVSVSFPFVDLSHKKRK